MGELNFELLSVILFLSPGFLAVYLYYGATETRMPSAFNLVVLSLVYSVFGSVLSQAVFAESLIPTTGSFRISGEALTLKAVGYAALCSTLLAILVAYLQNYGYIYSVMKALRLTRKTGRLSIWHDVFSEHRGCWVEVQYHSGDRIIGWPQYYSVEDGVYEIFLKDATLHPVEGEAQDFVCEGIYINCIEDVRWVSVIKS